MPNPEKISRLISLFFSTNRAIRQKSNENSDFDPMTIAKLETLRFVEEEQPTMKELARFLRIKAPSATSIVINLEKSGHLKRQNDKKDKRTVNLKITPAGKLYLKKGTSLLTSQLGQVLSRLDDDLINKFIDIMEQIKKEYE